MSLFGRIFRRNKASDFVDTLDMKLGRVAEGTAPEVQRPTDLVRAQSASTAAIVSTASIDGWFDTITDWTPDDVVLSSACSRKPVTHVVDRIECERFAFSEDDLEIFLDKLEPLAS